MSKETCFSPKLYMSTFLHTRFFFPSILFSWCASVSSSWEKWILHKVHGMGGEGRSSHNMKSCVERVKMFWTSHGLHSVIRCNSQLKINKAFRVIYKNGLVRNVHLETTVSKITILSVILIGPLCLNMH